MEKKKSGNLSYIVSKRIATQLSVTAGVVTSEELDSTFAVCGNQILQYSLTTGILLATLRSKRQREGGA